MGEVVSGPAALDRAGALSGRAQIGSAVRADGRVDWMFTDGEGRAGLVDGAAFVGLRPAEPLRVDLLYDAYSSLLYQSRTDSIRVSSGSRPASRRPGSAPASSRT